MNTQDDKKMSYRNGTTFEYGGVKKITDVMTNDDDEGLNLVYVCDHLATASLLDDAAACWGRV